MPTKDIAKVDITDEQLSGIKSFEDAITLLRDLGAVPVKSSDYGTGFVVVEKETLIAIPFVILDVYERDGDYKEGYVSVEAVTKDGAKVVFNDSSATGVAGQLRSIIAQRTSEGASQPTRAIMVENGLKRRDFWYNEQTQESSSKRPEGEGWIPAKVYTLV